MPNTRLLRGWAEARRGSDYSYIIGHPSDGIVMRLWGFRVQMLPLYKKSLLMELGSSRLSLTNLMGTGSTSAQDMGLGMGSAIDPS